MLWFLRTLVFLGTLISQSLNTIKIRNDICNVHIINVYLYAHLSNGIVCSVLECYTQRDTFFL
jgi:hypothetical protein